MVWRFLGQEKSVRQVIEATHKTTRQSDERKSPTRQGPVKVSDVVITDGCKVS